MKTKTVAADPKRNWLTGPNLSKLYEQHPGLLQWEKISTDDDTLSDENLWDKIATNLQRPRAGLLLSVVGPLTVLAYLHPGRFLLPSWFWGVIGLALVFYMVYELGMRNITDDTNAGHPVPGQVTSAEDIRRLVESRDPNSMLGSIIQQVRARTEAPFDYQLLSSDEKRAYYGKAYPTVIGEMTPEGPKLTPLFETSNGGADVKYARRGEAFGYSCA